MRTTSAQEEMTLHGAYLTAAAKTAAAPAKPNALEQIFTDLQLVADGAVLAGAVMVGFDRNIDSGGQA